MRVTWLVVMATVLASGCGATEDQAAALDVPDSGVTTMEPGAVGGSGGSGGEAMGTGGAAGASAGGAGGAAASPDAGGSAGSAGAPGMAPDAMPAAAVDTRPAAPDTMPVTGPPVACVTPSMLYSDVCFAMPGVHNSKVLYKDGRACNYCVTAKPDGTVNKQYVGCIPAAGAICVMSCGECRPQ